jgi:FNIP Repeat
MTIPKHSYVIDENLYLRMGCSFNEPIDHVLNGVKGIVMGYAYRQPLRLPNSVQYLKLNRRYYHDLTLPQNLQTLILGENYNGDLGQLPESLKKLILGFSFNCPLQLPSALEHFELDSCSNYNLAINIPETMKTLILNNNQFNQELHLPEGLIHLQLGNYNKALTLPSTLEELKIRSLDIELELPEFLCLLRVQNLTKLPVGRDLRDFGWWYWKQYSEDAFGDFQESYDWYESDEI